MPELDGPARSASETPNLVPPQGNPRFPLFDGLRAIAALSVFAGHTVTEDGRLQHNALLLWGAITAYQGVAVFFLISGFLLYRPFLVDRRGGAPLRVAGYAGRRVLRIVPAYWVAMTIFIAAGLVSGVTTHNWWIFYGFGQNYSATTLGQGLGVAWTLCIEVTFYAALPVFAFVAARLSRRAGSLRGDLALLVVLSAASLVFRAHFDRFQDVAKVSTLAGTFLWFALGMGLAIWSVQTQDRRPDLLSRLPRAWPVVSWAAAIGLFVLLHQVAASPLTLGHAGTAVVSVALYGLVAFLILLPGVFGQADGGPVRTVLAGRLAGWIGLVSYAFYLYHSIVLSELHKAFKAAGTLDGYLLVLACALPLTLACAAASYYVLERPVMLLGRRPRGRTRPA